MAPFDLQIWTPVILAISAAVQAWMAYVQDDKRLELTTTSVHSLHALLVWWNGLTTIQRRMATNGNYLVKETEKTIREANFISGSPKFDEDLLEEEESVD